ATSEASSTHSKTCANCGDVVTEACSFTDVVTPPTTTSQGYTTHTCSVCGYSYKDNYTDPTSTFTVTYYVNGSVVDSLTQSDIEDGTAVTLAAAQNVSGYRYDYKFLGWADAPLDADTATEPTVYAAGENYTVSQNTSFYAVYSYMGSDAGNTYEPVTTAPSDWSGNYVIVNSSLTNALAPTQTKTGEFDAVAVTVTDNKVADPASDIVWTFVSNGNGAYYIYNSNGYLQISGTSSTSAALTTTAKDSFTIESSSTTGVWKVVSTTNTARCFSYYAANQSFRTYAKSTNNTGYLFKATGTTYYATSLQAPCTHTNTTIETVEATCTTAGYAKEVCNDCGAVVDYVDVEALGHSYGSATNTGDAAMHTYTCSRCGDSYTEDHSFSTSVSGDTTTYTCTLCNYSYAETVSYTLTYVVPTSETAPAAATGTSATLPSMSDYISGTTSYTFVGWVATPTSATTTEPTLYAANSTYNFSADTKLYACYTYDVTSGGSGGDYVKVTSEPTSWAGEYVLVYETDSYILDGSLTTLDAASNYQKVTISDNTISAAEGDPYKITIAASGDAYTIQTVSGYYIGATSNANTLNSSTSTAYTNTISLDADGNATIISSGGAYMRYNASSGQYRFRYYKSSSYTAQKAVALYVKQAGSGSGTTTTYYTTDDAASTTTVTYTVGLVADTTKIEVGGTAYLTATLYADGVAVDGAVPVWTNSQSSVATIETADEICTVTGVASGTTQVRATFTCPDGSTKYSYKTITVGSTSTSGPGSAEEVNYVTSGSYIYNWGTRGTTATFLTTYATDYYTGSYSYDTLSALSGTTSTSASDIYNSALGQAIHSMLAAKQTYTTSYDATRDLFCYTDCEESNTSKISSYYSGNEVSSTWDSGATWNREHTWPNSKGLNGSDENDIMMLRPTSVSENSSRGNTAYGESSGYYDPNSVSSSALNLHDDVARLMLQHMMRWGNTDNMFGSSGVMESRAVLLKWMEEDPVDTWEMGRNDAVQAITGVRNVFVDYPELGFLLLGAEVPSGYTTPSGSATKTAAVSVSNVEASERSATRATETANYSGAAFIDGIGNTSSVEEMNKYGPKNEVYLANGQAIVFYLVGDNAIQNLQIGAKAANGTAQITITALNSTGDKIVLDKALASATEMYYEFGSGINWTGGVSSAIVIQNTGTGVLSITNLRYLTADGSLAFYVNSSAVAQTKLLMVTGSSVPETEPELPEDDVTPTEPVTPGDVPGTPTEPSEGVVPSESVKPSESTVPSEPEETTDPTEPAEPEYKVEQFKDVSEEDWYYDGVKYAVDSGLMNGVAPDAFAPDDTLTRAMLVTILYRLAGKPSVDEKTEIAFTDVDADGWYYDAVVWAVSNDITNGVSAELFAPDDAVTREQLVTFLWRYKGEPESKQSLDSFPDADKVSSFAETAMRWAVENKIVAGNEIDGKDYLDPQGNATRAQIAIIFMRSEKTLD
ncbi:MAG: S-layer homology domain-containing protein, partial [Faecousia sp.]